MKKTYDSAPRGAQDDGAHVTAREWNDDSGTARILLTLGGVRQTVVQIPDRHICGRSVSMRVLYDDAWRPVEVSTRLHDNGMKADGLHVRFDGDGSASLSEWNAGTAVPESVRTVPAAEAETLLAENPLFRLCETARTSDEKSVSDLYLRIIDNACDGQTEADELVEAVGRMPRPSSATPDMPDDLPYRVGGPEDMPFRIEGGRLTDKGPVSFEGLVAWFVGCDRNRQLDIFSRLGLEMPYIYGMDSFTEAFCSALTESPSVTLPAERLVDLYELYREDTERLSETCDETLMPRVGREVNVRMREGAAQRGSLRRGDARELGAQVLEAVRRRLSGIGTGEALHPLMCLGDGTVLTGENALAAAAAGVGRGWAPDFLTEEEMKGLGTCVVRPDAVTLTVKEESDAEGVVRTVRLYNIADTTIPQQRPEEWKLYRLARDAEAEELRKIIDESLPDTAELKEDAYDNILSEHPAFQPYAGFLRNVVDLAFDSVCGAVPAVPFDVREWPDELTAYHMARAAGNAAALAVKDIMPDCSVSYGEIEARAKEAIRKRKNSWAEEPSNGAGQGKGKGLK